jgi:HmuY protein
MTPFIVRTVCSTAIAVSVLACSSTDGAGEGEGEAPVSCEAAEVSCRDEAFVSLQMNLTETAADAFTNTAAGTGFMTDVDATAGGFGGTGPWVYGKFNDDGLKAVLISDDASFDSLDWDIAFRRFVVRLNSGTGGPSCVAASRTAASTSFDSLADVPEEVEWNQEQFMSGTCETIADGSGLEGSPAVVLQNWWNYDNACVATTGNVYLIQLADGRVAKLVIDEYYATNQATCNAAGGPGTGGGNFSLRWQFL